MGTAERRLDAIISRVDAVDPARVLARGWSITRTTGGTLVRGPADAPPGTRLVTTTAGGEVESVSEAGAARPGAKPQEGTR